MLTSVPKLLVLGGSLPGSRYGGGQVRDQILKNYPKDGYICVSVEGDDQIASKTQLPESLRGVHSKVLPLVPQIKLRGARFYVPFVRAVSYFCLARIRIQQIAELCRHHRVELIWAELQGDTLVIAKEISSLLGVPFVGTVWDDPEGWLADGGYDHFSRVFLKRWFVEALRDAKCVSTAGEAMQEAYLKEYGVKSVILRHGFERAVVNENAGKPRDSIIIGFVGSTYGSDAWTAFLSAVARLNDQGKLPQIKIRVFGSGKFPYEHPDVQIENRGWQPANTMLEEIAQTDFCYLPYWFDPRKRRHVELSFPNKFETYLAAGRPVLFHGPKYAGIASAVEKYGVGIALHSLDVDKICSTLEVFVSNKDLQRSYRKAAIDAYNAEFNSKVLMRNFAAFIGVHSYAFINQY